jgi:ATP-dependent metalloprotease
MSTPWKTSTSLHSQFQTQTRSFFGIAQSVTTQLQNLQLKGLETVANSKPNDPLAQYEFLSKLIELNHPQAVVDRVGHSMFRHFVVDPRIAVLYLQALQQSGQSGQRGAFQQFHLEDLTARLQQHQPYPVLQEFITESRNTQPPPSKPQQVAALLNLLQGGGMGAAGAGMMGGAAAASGGALSRGVDPKFPLHVQLYNPSSAKSALLALTGRVLIAFVVVSALSAIMDEKGVGRNLGMSSGSKHIQQVENTTGVGFDDVKGVQEAKAELEEIVLYLKNPSKFTRLGGKLPRGLLLTGPPGTGKTLLAKAIAGEAQVPFFFCSGSQFEEVYVGLGAKRIRELFEAAKKKSPCIIFIDEIDAVGGTRKLKDQSALKMTLNELLVQLDGFEENNGIIVIGATNFAESLDEALLRPGRFDKHVVVPLPDVGGRKEILELYAKKTKLHPNVDLNVLARGTTGFSGADLFNLMNQAALKASVDGLNNITMTVLEYAKDKIVMGAERKTAVITKETAKCTAYHEAGHALVAVLTLGSMPSKYSVVCTVLVLVQLFVLFGALFVCCFDN